MAITLALHLLNNPDCANAIFPNSTINPGFVLVSLEKGTGGYGYFQINDITQTDPNYVTNATEEPLTSRVEIGPMTYQTMTTGAVITINDLAGDFVNNQSDYERAVTIIHELGHAFNDIPGLGGSAIQADGIQPDGTPVPNGNAISQQNTALIKKNCK